MLATSGSISTTVAVLGSGSQTWSPTRFRVPVIDAGWIEDGTHVTTIGPKTATAHEAPPELADQATVIAGDSRGQAQAYGELFFTERPLIHLGAIRADEAPAASAPTG